jgi:hypothetical protein
MLSFPIKDIVFPMLPWGLFAAFLFQRDYWKKAVQSPFIQFCLVVFLSNIWVYWI